VFGWIEYIGGIAKLALVVGVIILMAMINAGSLFKCSRAWLVANIAQLTARKALARNVGSLSDVVMKQPAHKVRRFRGRRTE
jgi:hypothetical protein